MTDAILWTLIAIAVIGMVAVLVAIPIAIKLQNEREGDPS